MTQNMSRLAVAHIDIIPPEILGEIFAYTASLDPDAPLTLAQVSRTFYRLVYTAPHAWTTLRLVSSQDAKQQCLAIRKAAHWFGMAGGCTVNLYVEMKPRPRTSPLVITPHRRSEESEVLPEGDWERALPHVLRDFQYRIQTLEIHSTTSDEVRLFFNCLYPFEPLESVGDESVQLPLRSISLHTSQTSGNISSHGSFPHQKQYPFSGTSFPSLSQPRFSHLEKVDLVNHYLPTISPSNLHNLKSLCITYPLRFTPIPMQTLLQVIEAAPQLEVLAVEARMVDPSAMPLSPVIPTSDGLSRSPHSHPRAPSEAPISISPNMSSNHADLNLITLPNLTHLSLRINNLPGLLKHLLLPALHTLRLDDLDGKRLGAASQTGEVLRQLLVRMELPCEGVKRKGVGFEVLEMCSIALTTPINANGHSTSLDNSEDVWGWCFRRMRTLKDLKVSKMDTGALLAMITPRMVGSAVERQDDVVLPNLRKLVVHEPCSMGSGGYSSSSLATSSSFPQFDASLLHPSSPSGPILKFQMRRPDVDVVYSAPTNLVRALSPNIDFLELYTRH